MSKQKQREFYQRVSWSPKIFLDAVRALDGREICGQRVRVEMRKKQRRIGNERTENDLR